MRKFELHPAGVLYGKKKEIVAKMVPKTIEKKPRRILCILEGKGTVEIEEDFKKSPEEFLAV